MNTNAVILGLIVILLLGGGAYWYSLETSSRMEETANTSDNVIGAQVPITSGENPKPGDQVHGLPVEPAAAAARAALALKLGQPESSIVIMNIKDTEWSDGCLGLGGPAESCMMMIVPGFEVELLAKTGTHIYRTDKTGASIREATR